MKNEFQQSIEIAAPMDKVWQALTDYRQFGVWFLVDLENPFAVGDITHGVITHPACPGLRFAAITLTMDYPASFSFRWPHEDDMVLNTNAIQEGTTEVEFSLSREGENTQLTVRESGFDFLPAERREAAFKSNYGGWQEQLENIRAYVEA